MRILQLIDSLQVGGAERMAVNYANALADRIPFSGLVASRKDGVLKSHLHENVPFFCLYKKYAIDIQAILKLRAFCKNEKITWIHAHGTSYFTAFLLKLIYPKIKIVWHEHFGARSSESAIRNKALWFCVKFFSGIIVVNHELENWCKLELQFQQVLYLPNYTIINAKEKATTSLKGINGKRILYLANLRHPKNHKLLVEVALKIRQNHPEWSFHFVGKDLEDDYALEVKDLIKKNKLEDTVFIYGLKGDIDHIIDQTSIGVIASSSEGLPVSLLEYGLHGKPVVVTSVGEIPLIIQQNLNGFVVPSENKTLFYDALLELIEKPKMRIDFGKKLRHTILENHSQEAIIEKYLNWLKKI